MSKQWRRYISLFKEIDKDNRISGRRLISGTPGDSKELRNVRKKIYKKKYSKVTQRPDGFINEDMKQSTLSKTITIHGEEFSEDTYYVLQTYRKYICIEGNYSKTTRLL